MLYVVGARGITLILIEDIYDIGTELPSVSTTVAENKPPDDKEGVKVKIFPLKDAKVGFSVIYILITSF